MGVFVQLLMRFALIGSAVATVGRPFGAEGVFCLEAKSLNAKSTGQRPVQNGTSH